MGIGLGNPCHPAPWTGAARLGQDFHLQTLRSGVFIPQPGHAFMRLVRHAIGRQMVPTTGTKGMSTQDEFQAATDRITDQVRRLLARETTFAELYEFIREELRIENQTNQQN